jgi:hypothetical protein
VQLQRCTCVAESGGDTRTADQNAFMVTHVRGRADGPTAERAARAEPPPTAAEPPGRHPRRTQGLAALPTTHQAQARTR